MTATSPTPALDREEQAYLKLRRRWVILFDEVKTLKHQLAEAEAREAELWQRVKASKFHQA